MDIKKLTSDINKWRIEHQDNRYIREQILLNLKEEAGISTDITNWLIPHLFVTTKQGKRKMYAPSKNPIHFSVLEKIIEKRNSKKRKSSKDPIMALKEQGYIIQKPVGFNEELFKKENPELYKKYVIYEEY